MLSAIQQVICKCVVCFCVFWALRTFFFMFSDIKTLAEGSSVSLLSFHSTSSPYPPLSARPNLLKLPASSCCYEPRGFSAVLWGRSHALLKRKKGRETAITISEPQKKWEKDGMVLLHVSLSAPPCKLLSLLALSNLEKWIFLLHWLLTFFSGQKFSLFFQGGGVVRKLETEPPTVEVSQPGI